MPAILAAMKAFREAGLREVTKRELRDKGVTNTQVDSAVSTGLLYEQYYMNGAYFYGLTALGAEKVKEL